MDEIVEELTAGDTILPAPEREAYPRTTFDAVTASDDDGDEGPDDHVGYRQIPHRPKTLQISGVPARLTAELERLAARRGQTMASYLRGLVYDHLEEINTTNAHPVRRAEGDEGPDDHGGYRQTERYHSGPARRCTAPSCRCESPCDTYCHGRWR